MEQLQREREKLEKKRRESQQAYENKCRELLRQVERLQYRLQDSENKTTAAVSRTLATYRRTMREYNTNRQRRKLSQAKQWNNRPASYDALERGSLTTLTQYNLDTGNSSLYPQHSSLTSMEKLNAPLDLPELPPFDLQPDKFTSLFNTTSRNHITGNSKTNYSSLNNFEVPKSYFPTGSLTDNQMFRNQSENTTGTELFTIDNNDTFLDEPMASLQASIAAINLDITNSHKPGPSNHPRPGSSKLRRGVDTTKSFEATMPTGSNDKRSSNDQHAVIPPKDHPLHSTLLEDESSFSNSEEDRSIGEQIVGERISKTTPRNNNTNAKNPGCIVLGQSTLQHQQDETVLVEMGGTTEDGTSSPSPTQLTAKNTNANYSQTSFTPQKQKDATSHTIRDINATQNNNRSQGVRDVIGSVPPGGIGSLNVNRKNSTPVNKKKPLQNTPVTASSTNPNSLPDNSHPKTASPMKQSKDERKTGMHLNSGTPKTAAPNTATELKDTQPNRKTLEGKAEKKEDDSAEYKMENQPVEVSDMKRIDTLDEIRSLREDTDDDEDFGFTVDKGRELHAHFGLPPAAEDDEEETSSSEDSLEAKLQEVLRQREENKKKSEIANGGATVGGATVGGATKGGVKVGGATSTAAQNNRQVSGKFSRPAISESDSDDSDPLSAPLDSSVSDKDFFGG